MLALAACWQLEQKIPDISRWNVSQLKNCPTFKARYQTFRHRSGNSERIVIVDAAHNKEGMSRLIEHVDLELDQKPTVCITSMIDKRPEDFGDLWQTHAAQVIYFGNDDDRSIDESYVAQCGQKYTYHRYFDDVLKNVSDGVPLVVCGSVMGLDQVLKTLHSDPSFQKVEGLA